MNSCQFVQVRAELADWIPAQTFPRPEDIVMKAVEDTRKLYKSLKYPDDIEKFNDSLNLWRYLQAAIIIERHRYVRRWYHVFYYPKHYEFRYEEFSKALAICNLQLVANSCEIDKFGKGE